jgi:26S proteasome regulatory subunit N9
MAFLELAFSLPKNNRICTFDQIASVANLDKEKVEALVITTLSKGLVRGTIN